MDQRSKFCFKQRCAFPTHRNGGIFANLISARPVILQQPPPCSPTLSDYNYNTGPSHARNDSSNLLYTPKTDAFEPDSYSTPYVDQQIGSKTEYSRGIGGCAQPISGFASFAHPEDMVHLPHNSSPRSHIYQPSSPSPRPSMTLAEHRVRFQPSHQTQFYSPAPVHLPLSSNMEFSAFPQSSEAYQSHYGTEEELSDFSFAPAWPQPAPTPHQSPLPMAPIFSAPSAPSLPECRFSPVPVQTSLADLAPAATSSDLSSYPNLTMSEIQSPITTQSIYHTDSTISVASIIPQSLAQAHQDILLPRQKKKQKRRDIQQNHYKIKGREAIRFLEDMAESLSEGEIDPSPLPMPSEVPSDRWCAQVSRNRIYHNQSIRDS